MEEQLLHKVRSAQQLRASMLAAMQGPGAKGQQAAGGRAGGASSPGGDGLLGRLLPGRRSADETR